MSDQKAYVLFPGAAKNPLYSGWIEDVAIPVEIVREYDTEWSPPDDAAIVITHNHYRWEELSILRRVFQETQVPLLILVDGILEFRNSFEHPDLAEGSMFQPLIGHKLACIGTSQVRWIESWGNAGKCELVGLPRFDDLINQQVRDIPDEGPFRLLVATARTPWFNAEQRELTYQAIGAVKEFVDNHDSINGRPLEVVWRMAEELHINLQAPGYVARPGPVRKTLENVHAVLTTPSTLQLEAAIMGLPVAIVDFHNSPQLSPMAWTIGHESQVPSVIGELVSPPPAKKFVQDVLLCDALQKDEPAGPRMARLISEMVDQGRAAKQANRPLELAERILSHPRNGFAEATESGARSRLFPNNPVFEDSDVQHLQTELAAAIHEMGNYPEKYFHQRTVNQKLRSYVNWLRLLIRNRAATVEELSGRLQSSKNDRSVNDD